MCGHEHTDRFRLIGMFFFTLLMAVGALTLADLYGLQILPAGWLLLGAGCLGLLCLSAYHLLFRGRPGPTLMRLCGCMLCAWGVGGCLVGAYGTFLLEDTFGAVVDSAMIPGQVQPDNPTEEPFAIYLSGSDTRSAALNKSRSDVNIIAVVNPETKQVLLVNTPRDYYVPNPAGGGAKDKLTHCGLYGTANSAQALSALYGIPISYTAQINFKGFETLVDAIGGVTVYSDRAFTTSIGGYAIAEGENTLNGAQALAFARERSRLPDGDNGRGRNQMQVIGGMVAALTRGNLLTNYKTLMSSLDGMFTTSMPAATMSRLIRMQLTDMASWQVYTYAVTGSDGKAAAWSSGPTKVYVMYPDGESVARAAELMETVMRGELLTNGAVGQ